MLANITDRGNSNPDSYFPSEDYSSSTRKERDLWRKILPNMKSILLKVKNSNNRPNNGFNSNKSNNPSHKTVKPPSYNEKSFTKPNLHELLNELIVESNESEDASIVAENAIDNNESTLLVN